MEATTMERPTTQAHRPSTEYYDYWRSLSRDNAKLPAHLFLLHDLIRDKDPKGNSFSPITNKNKLTNGSSTWHGLRQAVNALSFWISHGPNDREKKLMELAGMTPGDIQAKLSLIKS